MSPRIMSKIGPQGLALAAFLAAGGRRAARGKRARRRSHRRQLPPPRSRGRRWSARRRSPRRWRWGPWSRSLPPSCSTVMVGNVAYQQCGSTWYQPRYAGSAVTYVVVNPPR